MKHKILFLILFLVTNTQISYSQNRLNDDWRHSIGNWTASLERNRSGSISLCGLSTEWEDDRGHARSFVYMPDTGIIFYWQRADLSEMPRSGNIKIQLNNEIFDLRGALISMLNINQLPIVPENIRRLSGENGILFISKMREENRRISFFRSFIYADNFELTLPNFERISISTDGISRLMMPLFECMEAAKEIERAATVNRGQRPAR